MGALIIAFLVILILSPGLLLGFLASPWFFLILFLLLLLFPLVLAPRPDKGGKRESSGDQETPGPLFWILAITSIVFAVPVLLAGIILAPEFFLLILLVMLPLLWLAFGPSS